MHIHEMRITLSGPSAINIITELLKIAAKEANNKIKIVIDEGGYININLEEQHKE